MARQHASPILLGSGDRRGEPLVQLTLTGGEGAFSEDDIQRLIHEHPECLPIAEIDATYVGPVSICRELITPAGKIDNLLVTPSGLPVIVECKLWRNPEGRREVVGQILDYAKELSRWSSSDLQREVSRKLGKEGNAVLDLVRKVQPEVDEIAFNDHLTANLRRGRFLLLIIGDGIRQGVEAIAEYLQAHAGLHFSLGLVEMPIYRLPDGGHLVVPRVLAHTTLVTRSVVALPDGYAIVEADQASGESGAESDPDRTALQDAQRAFWVEFIEGLRLDDPDQPRPNPARMGYIALYMPAPNGSSWLTVYRNQRQGRVGVFLSSHRNTAGDFAMQRVVAEWDDFKVDLGGTAELITTSDGRPTVGDAKTFGSLDEPGARARAFEWLAERVNAFVNVLRPRVRSAVADYAPQRE